MARLVGEGAAALEEDLAREPFYHDCVTFPVRWTTAPLGTWENEVGEERPPPERPQGSPAATSGGFPGARSRRAN
jgi:hypothetical protein